MSYKIRKTITSITFDKALVDFVDAVARREKKEDFSLSLIPGDATETELFYVYDEIVVISLMYPDGPAITQVNIYYISPDRDTSSGVAFDIQEYDVEPGTAVELDDINNNIFDIDMAAKLRERIADHLLEKEFLN